MSVTVVDDDIVRVTSRNLNMYCFDHPDNWPKLDYDALESEGEIEEDEACHS